MNRKGQIGFSQRVRLEWLERTANLVLAGNDNDAIQQALQELLNDKLSVGGKAERGNREKVISILRRTWVTVPPELEPLRNEGLKLLQRLQQAEHLVVHWGMVIAAYPFWADVAIQTGRLLRLQGVVSAAQVQRRVREQYGERATVFRAARRVLRSYVDWRVLQDTDIPGTYRAGITLTIEEPHVIAWLIEASLCALGSRLASLKDLLEGSGLFPFHIKPILAEDLVRASPRLDIIRQGLDEDLVALR